MPTLNAQAVSPPVNKHSHTQGRVSKLKASITDASGCIDCVTITIASKQPCKCFALITAEATLRLQPVSGCLCSCLVGFAEHDALQLQHDLNDLPPEVCFPPRRAYLLAAFPDLIDAIPAGENTHITLCTL
jgi:hypothetical protein